MKHIFQEKSFKDIRELWMKNIEQDKLFTRILEVEVSWSFKILADFNLDMRIQLHNVYETNVLITLVLCNPTEMTYLIFCGFIKEHNSHFRVAAETL